MSSADNVLRLSLISHTNAGKTTLARTLLREDVGEVLDQAHVTERSEEFTMLEVEAGDPTLPEGGRIVLWDTPGFGDSARLLRVLEAQPDPLAWLAEQSFDRVHERALFSSQAAVQNVRDEADVVLYLVNASESPEDAGYVEPEMRILGWIGRPVIVLLNQTGAPENAEERRRAEERWRWHTASHAAVRDVIALDAFTRCWIQEGLLLLRLQALVPEPRRPLMTALIGRWHRIHMASLKASLERMTELLVRAASDAETLPEALLERRARRRAAESLSTRLDAATRTALDDLIALNHIEGGAARGARGELEDISIPGDRPDPRRAGLVGGVTGGALGGLAADLAHGGLTFGAGTILGALAGGLGLGGLAWGYEQLGGEREPRVVWSPAFLDRQARDAVLRYLAVAHYGRGGGLYQERQRPPFWSDAVEAALRPHERTLHACWRKLQGGADEPQRQAIGKQLSEVLLEATRQVLSRFYPGSERFLRTP